MIEIGMIPKDWEVVRLGNVVEIHDGKRIPLSEMERANRKGIYPYCGANGIIDYINDYIFDGEFVLLAEDGGDYGRFGKSAYLMGGKFWVNNHAHILNAIKNATTNLFLLYSLNFLDLNPYIVGSTRKKLNQEQLREIKLPLPPLPEQHAISKILSTCDDAIQKVDGIIAKTDRLKKGLMQELLTKGIGHKEFKETGIGRIPKEWEVARLGNDEITELIMGQSPPSSSYNENGAGLPFLQGKAEFGEIYPNIVKYTTQPLKIAEKEDILISVRAPVGDVNLAPFKLCIGRGLTAIRIKKGSILFYFYWLQKVKKIIENVGKGSTFKAITRGELENICIPVPKFEEQQKIVEILTTVDKKLELERNEKAKLERIKQGLMDLLLTGKIRVKVS